MRPISQCSLLSWLMLTVWSAKLELHHGKVTLECILTYVWFQCFLPGHGDVRWHSWDIPGVGRPYQSTAKQQRWFRVKASLGNPSFGCPKKWLRNEKCIHMHTLYTQKSNMKPGQEPTYHSFTPMASHLDTPWYTFNFCRQHSSPVHNRDLSTPSHPPKLMSSILHYWTASPATLTNRRTLWVASQRWMGHVSDWTTRF